MGVRRVTTGHDGDRSVFTFDAEVEPLTLALLPGIEFGHVWASLKVPDLPAGDLDVSGPYFPPPGGVRVARVVFPPDSDAEPLDLDMQAALVEAEAKIPGAVQYLEPDAPGMHATPDRRCRHRPVRGDLANWTTAKKFSFGLGTTSFRTAPGTPGATAAGRRA